MEIDGMVQETFNRYHKSVVQIIMKTTEGSRFGIGSGFIVGRKGTTYLVMTCSHCVTLPADSSCSDFTLSVQIARNTKSYEAKILHQDPPFDIAIIKVINVDEAEKCPILQFQILESLAMNTPVIQLGYILIPNSVLNMEPAVSPGTIITPYPCDGSYEKITYAAATKHGCSGSPLLMDFKVIGMLYSVSLTGQISYAKSSYLIRKSMEDFLFIASNVMTIEEMIQLILERI